MAENKENKINKHFNRFVLAAKSNWIYISPALLVLFLWVSFSMVSTPNALPFYALVLVVLLFMLLCYDGFKLEPGKALYELPLFWVAALLPLYTGLYLGSFIWSFNWQLTGTAFNNFLETSKLPLGIMALGIPFGVMVGSFHRTLQTAEQINQSKRHNNYRNFVDHKDGVVKKLLEKVDELYGDEYVARKIYDYFYPDSLPENKETFALSCTLDGDAIYAIKKLHEAFSYKSASEYVKSKNSIIRERERFDDDLKQKKSDLDLGFIDLRIESLAILNNFLKKFSAETGVLDPDIDNRSTDDYIRDYDFFCKLARIAISESLDGGKKINSKVDFYLDAISNSLFCYKKTYRVADRHQYRASTILSGMKYGNEKPSKYIDFHWFSLHPTDDKSCEKLGEWDSCRDLIQSGVLVSQEFMDAFEKRLEKERQK